MSPFVNLVVLLLSTGYGVSAQSSASSSAGATAATSAGAAAPVSASGSAGATTVTQALATSTSFSVDPNLPQTAATVVAGETIPSLSALTSGAATQMTQPLATTYPVGETVTAVSGAPPLPTNVLTIANYPALDMVPPTNSSEVQQWLSEIDMSKVPPYSQTDGTCAGSPSAITDGRCWWTCGGCTRATDITVCPDKMTWGLSYDDGPSPYTPLLLDYLSSVNLTTTFFVVGSRVLSRPEMLQAEFVQGHQISVHTWSHPSLTTLTNEQIVAELGWTKKVIKDTIGVTPNTWRPPYGDIDDRVRAIAAQMGLTPIIWSSITENGVTTDFDTDDWHIPGGGATGPSSLSTFETILDTYAPQLDTGFIVLEHDLYQQTVDLAVGYVLPMAIASGKFQLKSIISCLGRPNSEAYIELSSNTTQTLITSAATTWYQASIGSASGAAVVTQTGVGSAASGSSTGGSGSGSGSGTASAAASSTSGKSGAASRTLPWSGGPIVAGLCLLVGAALVL